MAPASVPATDQETTSLAVNCCLPPGARLTPAGNIVSGATLSRDSPQASEARSIAVQLRRTSTPRIGQSGQGGPAGQIGRRAPPNSSIVVRRFCTAKFPCSESLPRASPRTVPRCAKYPLLSNSIPSSRFRPGSNSGTGLEIRFSGCPGRGGVKRQTVETIKLFLGGGSNEVAGIGNRNGARARVRERRSGGELPVDDRRTRQHHRRRWRGQQQS